MKINSQWGKPGGKEIKSSQREKDEHRRACVAEKRSGLRKPHKTKPRQGGGKHLFLCSHVNILGAWGGLGGWVVGGGGRGGKRLGLLLLQKVYFMEGERTDLRKEKY